MRLGEFIAEPGQGGLIDSQMLHQKGRKCGLAYYCRSSNTSKNNDTVLCQKTNIRVTI